MAAVTAVSKKCPQCKSWLVGTSCRKCGVTSPRPEPVNRSPAASPREPVTPRGMVKRRVSLTEQQLEQQLSPRTSGSASPRMSPRSSRGDVARRWQPGGGAAGVTPGDARDGGRCGSVGARWKPGGANSSADRAGAGSGSGEPSAGATGAARSEARVTTGNTGGGGGGGVGSSSSSGSSSGGGSGGGGVRSLSVPQSRLLNPNASERDSLLSRGSYNTIMRASHDIRKSLVAKDGASSRTSSMRTGSTGSTASSAPGAPPDDGGLDFEQLEAELAETAPDAALSGLAADVCEQWHMARARPAEFAAALRTDRLPRYEGADMRIEYQGDVAFMKTREGAAPCEALIKQLDAAAAVHALKITDGLCKLAAYAKQVSKTKPNVVEHYKRFGTASGTLRQVAWTGKVGSAAMIVQTLLIDDGNAKRTRRAALLDAKFRYGGIAAGQHDDDFWVLLVLCVDWVDGASA